jgi:SAM-dependent methyltransferase
MSGRKVTMGTRRAHWDHVYETKHPDQVSWFSPENRVSLEMIEHAGVAPSDPVIDIGSGASLLTDALLARGYADVTIVDISASALDLVAARLGPRAAQVRLITSDVTELKTARRYAFWHDRATFHFLVDDEDRAAYRRVLMDSLLPGAHVAIATFADDGPEKCSGLPVRRHSPEELSAFFAPELAIVESRREEHVTPGGAKQRFAWVLLRKA